MKTTPIYGLPYIEDDDLVSAAPAQFKTMAEGIETALVEVDSRNTPAGVKPVIATTLEALAAQTGVTGQTGYVTADTTTANNGPYFWNGSAWLPYATGGMLDDLRNQLTQGYGLPIVKVGSHTVTTDADGTFLIKVGFPDGRKPDYYAYMVGPFGANFQDEDGYIVHNWGTSQTDSIRFRLYSAKYQQWVGRVAIFGYWVAVWNALPIS